ncbi:hypothetical protein [Bacillus thermotolerans]|uniref:Uncharacterized protein n=1 Tax=Bacillus thermotolerans TaxID=1221996 RepID=A0A0F5I5Y4_BACTR|nr:hypothetical protein [Bacillus thermotolerans]KKB38019.1 hypothetical protein QY97_03394 [Bacillus thermotolerans]KKB40680.1 hypothetical protein QY95_01254 [Bacillus thermotolerans]KKB43784.1 hypothetical protein QY96_00553 [Bacillus thermotolerans]
MNNQRTVMTSLLAAGAAGAAIYGISRGMRNGTIQQMTQNVTSALTTNQPMQQIANTVLNSNASGSNKNQGLAQQKMARQGDDLLY